jgi:hypothetical protein
VSVLRLIVATRSSGPPASGKIIKEMPGSVASGAPYIIKCNQCTAQPTVFINRLAPGMTFQTHKELLYFNTFNFEDPNISFFFNFFRYLSSGGYASL